MLEFTKMYSDVITPTYATDGSIAFDLHYYDCTALHEPILLYGGEQKMLTTGLKMNVPKGYGLFLFPRSGMGCKGLILRNSVGLIDQDYRGEIKVCLVNTSRNAWTVKHGDRIAQACLISINQCSLVEKKNLSETDRGDGGFGSTGG